MKRTFKALFVGFLAFAMVFAAMMPFSTVADHAASSVWCNNEEVHCCKNDYFDNDLSQDQIDYLIEHARIQARLELYYISQALELGSIALPDEVHLTFDALNSCWCPDRETEEVSVEFFPSHPDFCGNLVRISLVIICQNSSCRRIWHSSTHYSGNPHRWSAVDGCISRCDFCGITSGSHDWFSPGWGIQECRRCGLRHHLWR